MSGVHRTFDPHTGLSRVPSSKDGMDSALSRSLHLQLTHWPLGLLTPAGLRPSNCNEAPDLVNRELPDRRHQADPAG